MYRPRKEYPSFSSSLLDEIYRSIDERDEKEGTFLEGILPTTSQKHLYSKDVSATTARGFQNDRRETIEKIMVRRKLSKDKFNSSSSSSGSSCGGGFSSSETESVYGVSSRPKPIRTNVIRADEYTRKFQIENIQTNSKHEGKFMKTKSRAMKIYGDLKKVKQPISPGGKLATFLNSIFNSKSKPETISSSTCSSASSFSRSCLSNNNTPSSRTKSNSTNNKKRSVRFFPDQDQCKPSTQVKFVKNPNLEEKSRRIEEAARTLLRNYQKKVECEFDLSKGHNEVDMKYEHDQDEDEDEDEDDDVSNGSSDLFELENFDEIGMEKYGDELPVYETTHLGMNLAIGNGFLM